MENNKVTPTNNKLTLMVECEDCLYKFPIGLGVEANDVQYKKKYVVNRQSIYLTYYDCPKCGRRHFVQIDNDYTLSLLYTVAKQFAKLSATKKQDKAVSQKQLDKFKRTQKYLADGRRNLMKKYTGVSVHDEATDSDFVLRFSVWARIRK